MAKLKIGITGQQGFVGSHLYNWLNLQPEIETVPFERHYFEDRVLLTNFVKQCDVIVHLAAMNRHPDPEVIYQTNIELVDKLISACKSEKVTPHILFSSSTQEEQDNAYGRSKREGRLALERWAAKNDAYVTGLIIPNVFGPFGRPYYNSVVATFCHQVINDESAQIQVDSEIKLIYVNDLVEEIYKLITDSASTIRINGSLTHYIEARHSIRVSKVLETLMTYKESYLDKGIFPDLSDDFEKALFNTFRCYIPSDFYPRPFVTNVDQRGMFVEIARTGSSGQTSYSTTLPGITRGNHFHTRKAERFAVIKGSARIQLRKVDSNEVINYYLDGSQPSYVDMPVWYTHNIRNIGEGELLTLFWINEPYNPESPDTYFVDVE